MWELEYKVESQELMLLNYGVGGYFFESPLDSEETNQSILKKINPEYSLEELMLKLQYVG